MVKWTFKSQKPDPWVNLYPKETPRQMEYEVTPMDEILHRSAKKYPDSQAIYFEGFRMTYAELNNAVDQFATGLSKMGIKAKDVVLIDTPNIPQYIIAFYAIVRIGAVANPIIPLNKYAEIVHQSNDSKAKALIMFDFLYEEYLHDKDLSKMTTLETIILTGLAEYLPKLKAKLGTALNKVPRMKEWPISVGKIKVQKFQDVMQQGFPIALPTVKINPQEDIAVLIYTGGTTGSPKGVMTTHFNLVSNAAQADLWVVSQKPKIVEQRGKGGMIIVLPLSHSFAMSIGMSIAVFSGYKMILFPQPPKKISDILKEAMKENAVFCPGVPTLWNKINQDPDSTKYKGKLPNFEACLSGAAALPLEVKNQFESLTGSKIVEGYGMSECSPMLTANPFTGSRENTVGFPMPDTMIKIMDVIEGKTEIPQCPHTGSYCTQKCGAEEQKYIGEICGCGPQVMQGYLGRPEDTAYALRKDANGNMWYYTTDIGCLDNDGYLHIKDRKRDMIKRKGHSVFPREIEDLMYTYEPILEVGVYGMKSTDVEIGEEIHAAVVLKPEYKGKTTIADISKWVQENIAPYKYPRVITIVDDLPKSIVGKVLRRLLRDQDTKKD